MTKLNRRHVLAAGLGGGVLSFAGLRARAADAAGDPPPLADYAKSPVIAHISISPDAQKIAVITQDGDDQYLKTFSRNSPDVHTIGFGKPKIRGISWADNDHVMVVTSLTVALELYGGFIQEFPQARIFDPVTGKFKLLWDKLPDISNAVAFGQLRRIKTADGYKIISSTLATIDTNMTNLGAEDPRSICLDAFSSDPNKVSSQPDTLKSIANSSLPCFPAEVSDIVLSPDGHVLAAAMQGELSHGVSKSWAVLWNQAGPGERVFMKEVYRTNYTTQPPELLGLSADGASVLMTVMDDDGWSFYVIDSHGKLSPTLSAGNPNTERGALFHPVTWRHAGFANYGEVLTYSYSDPLMDQIAKALPQVIGEEYRTEIVDFAEDPRQLIVRVEGADDPGSYWFLDLGAGVTTSLGSIYPQLPQAWVTQKTAIQYKAGDGLDIPAYLTLPPGRPAKDLPLIVLPHGGPEARDHIDFDWQVQALASRGYAVLQPNYRGSSGYGIAFTQAGYGEFGRKMQTDLSDGVRFLVAQGTVDPKRVAICGASYGGYAALAGATLDPGVYNCAISIAGVSDLKLKMQMLKDKSVNKYGSSMLYWQNYFGDKTDLDAISPIAHVDRVTIPILLIHGKDDTVVEYEHSVRMEKALKAAGKSVDLISYAGQDHWETIQSSRIDMITRIVDFLKLHNPA